ncbi:MAG: hypothetical protein ACSW8D_04285, partial [Prevotella sp.]
FLHGSIAEVDDVDAFRCCGLLDAHDVVNHLGGASRIILGGEDGIRLNQLQAYASLNNLYVWTKYSGIDPEVSARGYNPAIDNSKTPRSKQFTLTLNVGF